MPLILSLLGRYWMAIPILIGVAWIGGLHHELANVKADLVEANSNLATAKAVGAAQTAKAIKTEAGWKKTNQDLTHDAQAQLDAAAHDHESLSKRLRNAELRASQMPAVSSGGPVDAGTGGKPASTEEIDAAHDAYDSACQRDAIRLNFYDQREEALSRPF